MCVCECVCAQKVDFQFTTNQVPSGFMDSVYRIEEKKKTLFILKSKFDSPVAQKNNHSLKMTLHIVPIGCDTVGPGSGSSQQQGKADVHSFHRGI